MGFIKQQTLGVCPNVFGAAITWSDMLPGYDKQHTTDTQVSQQNIHPDVGRERVEEGENPRVGAVGLAVEYTYTQRHEGLREVDNLLTHICDGEWSHCQIRPLSTTHKKREEK